MSTSTSDDFTVGGGTDRNARFLCRMYENKHPEVEDVVVVQVRSIAELGAYVSLLEYNDIEGMILLSELSRRRIKSINKLIRVGRIEYVMVLRVDDSKGYIDLSKRRATPEEIEKAETRYAKSKAVHSILGHCVAQTKDESLESLYTKFGWPLARKYGHAHDGLKMCISASDKVWADCGFDETISPELKALLLKNIQERLTPQPVKVRADIAVTCASYAGVDAIKKALLAGMEVGSAENVVHVKLLAPLFVMWCASLEKDEGIALLEKAIAKVKEVIESEGGSLEVAHAPRSVSDREEEDLDMDTD